MASVPPDTQELALFVMNTQPVEERLFFGRAVSDPGFNPLELRNRILGLSGNAGLLAARYGC